MSRKAVGTLAESRTALLTSRTSERYTLCVVAMTVQSIGDPDATSAQGGLWSLGRAARVGSPHKARAAFGSFAGSLGSFSLIWVVFKCFKFTCGAFRITQSMREA